MGTYIVPYLPEKGSADFLLSIGLLCNADSALDNGDPRPGAQCLSAATRRKGFG